MDRSRREEYGCTSFGDDLSVLAGAVHASQGVLDPSGVHILRLVLSLMILEAEAMALAEDQELACVAVSVREPALFAPGLGNDLQILRERDLGVSP
jgi:hypothetical protein